MFWNAVENEYANTIELVVDLLKPITFHWALFLGENMKAFGFWFLSRTGKKKRYAYVSFLTAEMDPIPTLGCKKYQGNSQAMTKRFISYHNWFKCIMRIKSPKPQTFHEYQFNAIMFWLLNSQCIPVNYKWNLGCFGL